MTGAAGVMPGGHESLDLEGVRERFEASTDFTIAIEEEFALLDPRTLELSARFEELFEASQQDETLAGSAAGELIDSEIEIRSGRCGSFAELVGRQRERRARLFGLAEGMGIALAATGTHPWANYLDQRIIDTPHYRRLEGELRWVAQRNNTWSLHIHMGVRGAERAIAVCDHVRGVLPALLAASANSPFLDRHDTGLHSVRTEIRRPPRSSPARFPVAAFRRRSGAGPSTRASSSCSSERGRSSNRPSCGGAFASTTRSAPSRSGSATRRRAAMSRSGSAR